MRLQFISDLHLERYPDFAPTAAEGVDVLVLAGDIGSYQHGSLLRSDDFGLTRFSPRAHNSRWPRVLFVPGNHEFDSLDYGETYDRLRELCGSLGIEWLERETTTIGTVRFIGTTLWSDFDSLARGEPSDALKLRAREKAFRAANFYLRKNTTLKGGQPVMADGIREMALESQAWLREALAEPYQGKTVVVSHFAPSLRSADPRFGLTPGTAGFCNALDDLLSLADLWIHGHLHCPSDYVVADLAQRAGKQCRVVANPRGYASKGEQAAFRGNLIVEL